MATHSSVLAWGIPGTEEPGGLPSTGLHRVGHAGLGADSLLRDRGALRPPGAEARPLPSVPAERQEGYREGWHRRAASPARPPDGVSAECPSWRPGQGRVRTCAPERQSGAVRGPSAVGEPGEPTRTPGAQLRGPLAPSEPTPRGRPLRAGDQGRGHRERCQTSPLSALVSRLLSHHGPSRPWVSGRPAPLQAFRPHAHRESGALPDLGFF